MNEGQKRQIQKILVKEQSAQARSTSVSNR